MKYKEYEKQKQQSFLSEFGESNWTSTMLIEENENRLDLLNTDIQQQSYVIPESNKIKILRLVFINK
jgi:hypothetical protein